LVRVERIMTRKLSREELKDKLDGNELDLSLCNLTKVPVRDLAFMQQATILDLSCNNLTSLPDSFGSLTHLMQLDLSKNSLTDLPESFGQLTNLKRLDLYSNRLTELPLSFVQLSDLRWLDLKNNPIQALLPNVVGNCLNALECKTCARNVLRHLQIESEEREKEKEHKLVAERARKKQHDAAEEKQRELRKRLKQLEKQQRREAYETLNRQKRMMQEEMDRDLQAQKEFMETVPMVEKPPETDDLSSILGLVIIMTLITIAVTVGIVVFCYNDAACRELWATMTQS